MAVHEALLPIPVIKMGVTTPRYRGACSCGWVGRGAGSPKDARHATRSHVDDKTNAKLTALTDTAESRGYTPEQVLTAARAMHQDHYDFAAVAWEKGTTVLVVFAGEGGSGTIRQTLNAELDGVISSEKVRRTS